MVLKVKWRKVVIMVRKKRLGICVLGCVLGSAILFAFLLHRAIPFSAFSDYYQWDGQYTLQQQQQQQQQRNATTLAATWQPNGGGASTQLISQPDISPIIMPGSSISASPNSIMIARKNATISVPVLKDDSIMARGSHHAPIVIEQYKLVFFSIQKAGGTVWKQLLRRMLGHPDWKTGPTWITTTKQNPGFVQLNSFGVEKATQIMNDPAYIRATMVRDPKERFLSAYLDKAMKTDYFFHLCLAGKKQKQKQRYADVDCKQNKTACSFSQFLAVTESCYNSHWAPQSDRMEAKYYPLLDFVGHLETAGQDAKELLELIGAWDEYGKSGWGPYGNESIFQSNNVIHKTAGDSSASLARLPKYYTPELEAKVEQRLQKDYEVPQFNLVLKTIQYTETEIT
jgi:hypothetical protein